MLVAFRRNSRRLFCSISYLESYLPAELQPPHIIPGRQRCGLPGKWIRDVRVRQPEVRVIEGVQCICAPRKSQLLGDAENLRQRKVLIDEVRTVKRVHRVIAERVPAREAETRSPVRRASLERLGRRRPACASPRKPHHFTGGGVGVDLIRRTRLAGGGMHLRIERSAQEGPTPKLPCPTLYRISHTGPSLIPLPGSLRAFPPAVCFPK
jgi:hypothetical protein